MNSTSRYEIRQLFLFDRKQNTVRAIGNQEICSQRKLALFCSSTCPGSVILKTVDYIKSLEGSNTAVISGFHSPVEQQCLRVLQRINQPAILCPARSLEDMRLKPEWKKMLEAGNLLILSPFDAKYRRMTKELSWKRNQFVVSLADEVLVPFAVPGGRTERIISFINMHNKPILSLGSS